MSVTTNPQIAISGDGQSDAYQLAQSEHKVMVKYGSGVTGTITVKTGIDEDHLIDIDSLTGDEVIYVKGPGVLAFSMASYSGANGVQINIGEVLP